MFQYATQLRHDRTFDLVSPNVAGLAFVGILSIVMLSVMSAVIVSEGHAQQILFKENGEGLIDGQPVPGWTVCDGACASVTATTSVKKVGQVGIRVNGDNLRHKPLPQTLTGLLEMSLWMFPATDSNTNNSLRLSSPLTRETVIIRVNETRPC